MERGGWTLRISKSTLLQSHFVPSVKLSTAKVFRSAISESICLAWISKVTLLFDDLQLLQDELIMDQPNKI